jgi:hypothetical protein
MAVLKYYDGLNWEPVASALQGPTGPTGNDATLTGATGPTGPAGPTGSFSNAYSFNAQTVSYALVLDDAGKIVEINNGSANTLTVPLNSTQAFPVGTTVTILQTGTGQTTITPVSGGVTINATPGLKLRTQWSSATLIKRATDTWVAVGDLVA